MIVIENRRKKIASVLNKHPGALIIDLTSRADMPWVKFSPFYPHGGIPVPFSPGVHSMSVEGVWQALKVFETEDVDPSKLIVTSMRGIKRTSGCLGRVRGHRRGLNGDELLGYVEARRLIYIPTYAFLLETYVKEEIEILRRESAGRIVVLLDYETNGDIENVSRPLSHASLVARYVERSRLC